MQQLHSCDDWTVSNEIEFPQLILATKLRTVRPLLYDTTTRPMLHTVVRRGLQSISRTFIAMCVVYNDKGHSSEFHTAVKVVWLYCHTCICMVAEHSPMPQRQQ